MLLTFWQIAIVPFRGIRVFRKKLLPFSGGATGDGSGAACPFSGHSCFQNKCFAVFRGCNRRRIWCSMSLFGAFVFSGKSFCQNRNIKWPKTGQICTIIYAHVPFWDFHILNLNDLPKSGHATLCTINNMQSCINA